MLGLKWWYTQIIIYNQITMWSKTSNFTGLLHIDHFQWFIHKNSNQCKIQECTKLRALPDLVPYMPSCLTCPRALRVLVSYVPPSLYALVPYVPCVPSCLGIPRAYSVLLNYDDDNNNNKVFDKYFISC